jgi:O-acetyl-ADP-ribose deacetylase (regulator of RNase III)
MLLHNVNADAPIRSLLVPGFGTGVGKVAPEQAARQMRLAYNAIVKGHGIKPPNTGANTTTWSPDLQLASAVQT